MTGRQRKLLRRCEHQVNRLSIPSPFDLEQFLADLAARRGRPIETLPMTPLMSRFQGLTGLWVGTDDMDYIYFHSSVPTWHRTHIVLHEVGHMLFNHEGSAVSTLVCAVGIKPGLIRHFSLRGGRGYTDDQEREAETVASLITGRSARRGGSDRPVTSDRYVVPIRRIEALLAGELAP